VRPRIALPVRVCRAQGQLLKCTAGRPELHILFLSPLPVDSLYRPARPQSRRSLVLQRCLQFSLCVTSGNTPSRKVAHPPACPSTDGRHFHYQYHLITVLKYVSPAAPSPGSRRAPTFLPGRFLNSRRLHAVHTRCGGPANFRRPSPHGRTFQSI
jgi:hypothetical protein